MKSIHVGLAATFLMCASIVAGAARSDAPKIERPAVAASPKSDRPAGSAKPRPATQGRSFTSEAAEILNLVYHRNPPSESDKKALADYAHEFRTKVLPAIANSRARTYGELKMDVPASSTSADPSSLRTVRTLLSSFRGKLYERILGREPKDADELTPEVRIGITHVYGLLGQAISALEALVTYGQHDPKIANEMLGVPEDTEELASFQDGDRDRDEPSR
jgi:hypothetical protein